MKHLKIFVLSHIRILFLSWCLLILAGVTVANAKIAYCVDGDIYIRNDDGTNRRRLTKTTLSEDRHPNWSPDGKKIAFTSGRSGRYEVHVVDLETLAVTQLTGIEGEPGAGAPDWSPDGTQIVYEKFINNLVRRPGFAAGLTHKNIYVMSADGEQQPIFPNPQAGADKVIMRFFPRWSADGQRIVFMDCSWKGKDRTCWMSVARIGGEIQIIQEVHDKFGKDALTAGVCWIEYDQALLFALKRLDNPNAKIYNLYRYEFKTRSIKQLTRDIRDEKFPDWIEGALPVSPQGNLPTQWGEKKQDLSR